MRAFMEALRLLKDAMASVGAARGLDLRPSPDGVVSLLLAPGVPCHIEAPEGSDHLYFHAPVLAGRDIDDALLRRALAANMFGLRLPGGWLALDEDTEVLTLCVSVAAAAFATDMVEAILVAVLDEVDRLRAGLKPGANGPADAARTHESAASDIIFLA